jgi:hypothetical protein
MKGFLFRRPSPALAVSFVALLVALGGTSFAAFTLPKNSVGTKQLKKNAVTTSKIKNGAVTGSKVNLGSLGTVPNAGHASTADNAGHASTADIANSANTANNANALGGSAPSAFHDRCPSGTTQAAADLCVTNSDVGSGGSGQNTWDGALHDCLGLGLRLPSIAEAFLLLSATPDGTYWTDDFFNNGTTNKAVIYLHNPIHPTGTWDFSDVTSTYKVRCVTTPFNS